MDSTFSRSENGKEMTVKVAGELNTITTPALRQSWLAAPADGVERLIVDFADVDYISSAGLRLVIEMHKTMLTKGELIVRNPNSEVMDAFDMTGFSRFLKIERPTGG